MEKLQYDLFYIKNLSIGLDLFVLFKTVQTVVLKRGQ
jgi:lipopolysaccharide/colanic/teichoic acid biosynthesis glycosyltransferase